MSSSVAARSQRPWVVWAFALGLLASRAGLAVDFPPFYPWHRLRIEHVNPSCLASQLPVTEVLALRPGQDLLLPYYRQANGLEWIQQDAPGAAACDESHTLWVYGDYVNDALPLIRLADRSGPRVGLRIATKIDPDGIELRLASGTGWQGVWPGSNGRATLVLVPTALSDGVDAQVVIWSRTQPTAKGAPCAVQAQAMSVGETITLRSPWELGPPLRLELRTLYPASVPPMLPSSLVQTAAVEDPHGRLASLATSLGVTRPAEGEWAVVPASAVPRAAFLHPWRSTLWSNVWPRLADGTVVISGTAADVAGYQPVLRDWCRDRRRLLRVETLHAPPGEVERRARWSPGAALCLAGLAPIGSYPWPAYAASTLLPAAHGVVWRLANGGPTSLLELQADDYGHTILLTLRHARSGASVVEVALPPGRTALLKVPESPVHPGLVYAITQVEADATERGGHGSRSLR